MAQPVQALQLQQEQQTHTDMELEFDREVWGACSVLRVGRICIYLLYVHGICGPYVVIPNRGNGGLGLPRTDLADPFHAVCGWAAPCAAACAPFNSKCTAAGGALFHGFWSHAVLAARALFVAHVHRGIAYS